MPPPGTSSSSLARSAASGKAFGPEGLGYDHTTAAEEKEMFGLQNELLADWYEDLDSRGVSYQPKPSGPKAFPDAAERAKLDEEVPGGGI